MLKLSINWQKNWIVLNLSSYFSSSSSLFEPLLIDGVWKKKNREKTRLRKINQTFKMDTSEGLEPISVPENSGEKNISENVGQSAVMMQLVKVDKHELVHDIYSEIFSQQDKQVYLNDVEIRCQDGIVRVPAPLLSSISPLFRS